MLSFDQIQRTWHSKRCPQNTSYMSKHLYWMQIYESQIDFHGAEASGLFAEFEFAEILWTGENKVGRLLEEGDVVGHGAEGG